MVTFWINHFGKKILLFFTAEFSHFLSQIFWHFCAKNCDQKVTKFSSKKNFPAGKKKKSPPPRRTDARVQPFWGNAPVLGGGGLCCTSFVCKYFQIRLNAEILGVLNAKLLQQWKNKNNLLFEFKSYLMTSPFDKTHK